MLDVTMYKHVLYCVVSNGGNVWCTCTHGVLLEVLSIGLYCTMDNYQICTNLAATIFSNS